MQSWAKNKPGFTLVELLIVIVVIAILAAISVVAYNGIQNRAHDTTIQSDLNSFAKLIQLAAAETDTYPAGGAVRVGTSDTGNSTAFPGFKFQPSKQAYLTAATNLYYCTGMETASLRPMFRLLATSKSGNSFEYTSNSGMRNIGQVTINAQVACAGMNDPKTWAYGFLRPDTWYSWTN